MNKKFTHVITVSLLLLAQAVCAHGDVSEKIRQLNAKVAVEPDNLQWRFQRGVQWLLNQHADDALDDFNVVAARDPMYPQIYFYLARSHAMEGNRDDALAAFEMAVMLSADNAEAQKDVLIQRASFLQQQKRYAAAADDWRRVLQLAQHPQSDWWLLAARNLYVAGARDKAMQLLDESMLKMGPVLLFEEQQIDWLLAQQKNDAALQRLDQLVARSERPELWLIRKGDVLLANNDKTQALEHFQQALDRFAQLPDHVKQRPATRQQLQQLQNKIASMQ